MSRNRRRNRRTRSGASQPANRNANRDADNRSAASLPYRSSTETKSSLRTTELIAYAGAVLAVVMTALAVDADREGSNDPFGAESAIRSITYLTIGYMVARGLAKAGSHENRAARDTGPADDDAARDDGAHDDDTVDDEGADQRDGEVEPVDGRVVPSDETQRAEPVTADAKP